MIIEIRKSNILYSIIKRFKKVVIYFYVDWSSQCNGFNAIYLQISRENEYSPIAFCQVNVDLLPDIQELYDVNVYRAPCLITIKDGEIVGKLYGNKPEIFQDQMYDFSKL
jgi:thioredoxin-like negative regulator of GroEL